MKELPELSFATIQRMEDMSWFTHARIFDDLLIVAQKETCCYVWKTDSGLVIFDAIWPDERAFDAITAAIRDAGWDSEKPVAFVMTHGHIDHVGCGKWLVERYGVKAFLSQSDDKLRLAAPHEDGRSDSWKEFGIDRYVHDGDVLDFGGKKVFVLATPGHTEGCMSYFFPVTENGATYMAALFGGATAPWNDPEGRKTQLRSVEKFRRAAADYHAEVALTNHTAFDSGLTRIAYIQSRMKHLPNIYLLGERGVQRFCEVYRKAAE